MHHREVASPSCRVRRGTDARKRGQLHVRPGTPPPRAEDHSDPKAIPEGQQMPAARMDGRLADGACETLTPALRQGAQSERPKPCRATLGTSRPDANPTKRVGQALERHSDSTCGSLSPFVSRGRSWSLASSAPNRRVRSGTLRHALGRSCSKSTPCRHLSLQHKDVPRVVR